MYVLAETVRTYTPGWMMFDGDAILDTWIETVYDIVYKDVPAMIGKAAPICHRLRHMVIKYNQLEYQATSLLGEPSTQSL